MSGINFLLDTLLHQVLGKRVDTPAPERQPAPVKPLAPMDAVQELRSDSRLNARHGTPVFRGHETVSGSATSQNGSTAGLSPFHGLEPQEAGVHLSRVARVLSVLLQESTGEVPVIRPPRPLASTADVTATELASAFRSTVAFSGLFYESHLLQWYRGERERLPLDHEPQMQGGQGNFFGTNVPFKQESLHVLLRQQLELLTTPHLRWEGEVWPGLFLELNISAREHAARQEENLAQHRPTSDASEKPQDVWEAKLKFVFPVVGELSIVLHMSNDSLNLIASPAASEATDLVAHKMEALHRPLAALGFSTLQLDVGTVQ